MIKAVCRFITTLLVLAWIVIGWILISHASSISTQQGYLYPYQSSMQLQDEFITGGTSSGTIGNLGWVSAGTVSGQPSEVNRPGIFRIDTGAVSGTQARISFPNSSAYDPTLPAGLIWIARLNTNDANTTLRIGAGSSVAGNPPNNGYYFEKLDADTNWFCVSRSASVQTRTDTGVAVSTNFVTFVINATSSSISYSINGVSVCGAITTNITSAMISPYMFIINSTAASKNVDIDYFQMLYYGLTR